MRGVFQQKTIDAGTKIFQQVLTAFHPQWLQRGEEGDVEIQFKKFRLGKAGKTEVHKGGGGSIMSHVLDQRPPGLEAPNTPSELPVEGKGYEDRPRGPKGTGESIQIRFQGSALLQPISNRVQGDPSEGLSLPLAESPSSL